MSALTNEQLEVIRARHVKVGTSLTWACVYDDEPWPCDTCTALDALDAATRREAELRADAWALIHLPTGGHCNHPEKCGHRITGHDVMELLAAREALAKVTEEAG